MVGKWLDINEGLRDGIGRSGLGEGLCWSTKVLLDRYFVLLCVSLNYWICCSLVLYSTPFESSELIL